MPRPPRRCRTLAFACLAAAVAVGAGGCGADTEASQDEGAVRDVVLRFGEATRAQDWNTICDELFTKNLVAKVESIGLPCEVALQKGFADVVNPVLVVRDVGVNGARALVSVHSTADNQPPSDDAIQLVREDDEWRIASLASPDDPGTSTSTTETEASTLKTHPSGDLVGGEPLVRTTTTEARTTSTTDDRRGKGKTTDGNDD